MKKVLVVGFITDKDRVLLINKNRPAWQKGKFNGVGGTVEQNETPLEAMIREAREETNLQIEQWNEIDCLPYEKVDLYIYQAPIDSKLLDTHKSMTDEKISVFNKNGLPDNLVEDVKYIVSHRLNFIQ